MENRHETVVSGVVLPFLQALITGALGAGTATSAVWYFEWGKLMETFAVSFIGITLLVWVILLSDWRALLWAVERAASFDVDGDGFVGNPEPVVVERSPEIPPLLPSFNPVRLEVRTNTSTGYNLEFLDLPVSEEQASVFFPAVAGGATLAENYWCGQGKPFAQSEFRDLRERMIEQKWLFWRNPQEPRQGVELTRAGKAMVRYLGEHFTA